MRLVHLPANRAWAFITDTRLVRLRSASGPYPILFNDRGEALAAARDCALAVDHHGIVSGHGVRSEQQATMWPQEASRS